VIELLVDGLDHPEGVCWDPARGVVWAGGEAGQLYRVDVDARTWEEVARAPGFVLGLAADAQGRLALCCGDDGLVCVYDGTDVRVLRDGFVIPNYPAFGPDGTLYFSASGHWSRNDGHVYRLSPDGDLDVLTDRLPHSPNGCAVTADGRWLWIVESYRPALSRIDLHSGDVEEIRRLDGTVPDGVAFTETGVLVSFYRPDRIAHLDDGGSLEIVAEDPQGTAIAAPTNVVFAGPKRDRLVSANLGRWHLSLIHTELRGLPLHYPDRWAADA
jgi:gluconolactonase